jgi:transcriptional regulator with XRE-family HTH domain
MPPINRARARDRRDELDLSNKTLAEHCETSEGYMNNILVGHDDPSRRLTYRLARALAIDVSELDPPAEEQPRPPRRRPRKTSDARKAA